MKSVIRETHSMKPQEPHTIGSSIDLQGHIYAKRKLGGLIFLVVRTREGLVQVLFDQAAPPSGSSSAGSSSAGSSSTGSPSAGSPSAESVSPGSAGSLPASLPEYVSELEHLTPETAVKLSAVWQENPEKPGQLELKGKKLETCSSARNTLPVEIAKESKMETLSLNTLLEYRPLTLRNEKIRSIFRIEAEICRAFREFLSSESFTEIHSPKLVATGTEGGAQLFSVDYFGNKAYLAQSPQFYKQMMVGVFERVFEIGPVYRAEEHNTARHLNEYISMDFEMGFIESEQTVINMQKRLLKYIFEHLQETCTKEFSLFGQTIPKFETAPQLKLQEAISLLQSKLGWHAESGSEDLDPEGERLLCQYMEETEGSQFVYLTHYPSSVRPFYSLPEKGTVFSHSFDLLFRGLEITTGGQRIHEYEQLVGSIEKRGMVAESFADYLQCFKYGMPPHGGLAIGLERLAKQLLGLKNVRETSLFPRDNTRISP